MEQQQPEPELDLDAEFLSKIQPLIKLPRYYVDCDGGELESVSGPYIKCEDFNKALASILWTTVKPLSDSLYPASFVEPGQEKTQEIQNLSNP